MHKFIRSLAWLAVTPVLAASGALAGDTRIGAISDAPTLAQVTDATLNDPLGISATSTGPLWVSGEGSGIATIGKEEGSTSPGAAMALDVPIAGGESSGAENGLADPLSPRATAVPAGSSDSPLGGPENSFSLATTDGPVSACGEGRFATSLPGFINELFGILPADPMPISAVMGTIAVGSLAAARGWKNRRRPATA